MILLQPHTGNPFDDDWVTELEDIVERDYFGSRAQGMGGIGESMRGRRRLIFERKKKTECWF